VQPLKATRWLAMASQQQAATSRSQPRLAIGQPRRPGGMTDILVEPYERVIEKLMVSNHFTRGLC